jgi:hypothetical protein
VQLATACHRALLRFARPLASVLVFSVPGVSISFSVVRDFRSSGCGPLGALLIAGNELRAKQQF